MAKSATQTDITLAVLVSIAALVPLYCFWWFEGTILYLIGGGNFGGFGGAPPDAAPWVIIAVYGLLIVGILIDIAIGVHFYRRLRSRRH